MTDEIRIGRHRYQPVRHGVFEVPFADLGELRLRDVPYHSQLAVGVPIDSSFFHVSAEATHAGGPDNDELSFSIKVGYLLAGGGTDPATLAKWQRTRAFVRRVLDPIAELPGWRYAPDWMPFLQAEGGIYGIEALYRDFSGQENPVLASVVEPLVHQCPHLAAFRDTLVFVCHASEDKPFVDRLCAAMDEAEVPIWYDRREIRVGDSIVQRICDALGQASHLAIVLSHVSSTKPWVLRELSSGLMRQLEDASVKVLPVVLDDCAVPAILSDIRYADCRHDIGAGIEELLRAIGRTV